MRSTGRRSTEAPRRNQWSARPPKAERCAPRLTILAGMAILAAGLPAQGYAAGQNRSGQSPPLLVAAVAGTPTQAQAASPAATQYEPGWLVELRVLKGWNQDPPAVAPGVVAAYSATGPTFSQKEFEQKSGLSSRWIIAGMASKLVARTAGPYQIGLKIEGGGGNCFLSLTLNGKPIIHGYIGLGTEPLVPLQLSPGLYDVTLTGACGVDYGDTWTVMISHPGELAPQPALPGDFIVPARLPPPPSAPALAPAAPLPPKLPQ